MCHILHGVCSQTIYECGRKQNNHKLKPEIRDEVYCFLYREEYALPEKNESDSHSSTSDEEELEVD